MQRLLTWFWHKFRPQEGWFSLALLTSQVAILVGALAAAEWVPESNVVLVTGLLGLLLGTILAKRPVSSPVAWLFIILYGLLITVVYLGEFWPPFRLWDQGWGAIFTYWRTSGALIFDRGASWVLAVSSGGSSEETIIFSLGLGLIIWFLAAFTAWSTYRHHRPLLVLMLSGTALAINGFYYPATLYLVAVFAGLAAVTTAFIHYVGLEQSWRARSVDYSTEIRLELTVQAAILGLILLGLAFTIPAINLSRIPQFLLDQPALQGLEESWERAFGGVADAPGGAGSRLSAPGGSGLLPRSYLLGNAPELSETIVMEATLLREANGRMLPVTNASGMHWRALSYVNYTGRGWTRTEERLETMSANDPIPLPRLAGQTRFHQAVTWRFDERIIRYTLGFPLSFDQEVEVAWRGLEDLVRVYGQGTTYESTTRLTTADADSLRATRPGDVPPEILARYTQLPPDVPERVTALAAEIASGPDNPYDQARALESFLRQYEYSLEIEPPPLGTDVVDFFLFELQKGYCDFFASAMVVLARSLGLPARMAVGFLAQPPDENGLQTIYQINGHSWAEIYFADYGWVEFEPTAAFPSNRAQPAPAAIDNQPPPELMPTPPPLPQADPPRLGSPSRQGLRYLAVALLALLLGSGWWWQRRRQPQGLLATYGRFRRQAQQIGVADSPAQTPLEFQARLFELLSYLAKYPRLHELAQSLHQPVARLTEAYVRHQYRSPQPEAEKAILEDLSAEIASSLRRLQFAYRIRAWLRRPLPQKPPPEPEKPLYLNLD